MYIPISAKQLHISSSDDLGNEFMKQGKMNPKYYNQGLSIKDYYGKMMKQTQLYIRGTLYQ